MALIIGYARVSTDHQAERGASLDAQAEKVRALACLHDLALDSIMVDAGASAGSLKRPELAKLLALVEARKVSAVLVAKLDRLTRSTKDLAHLLDLFERRGVALLSAAESLDTRSAAGRLVINVLGSVSQWEREAIGERTADVLAHKRSLGHQVGHVPYGYQRGERLPGEKIRYRLAPHPEEQRTLRLLRRLRSSGLTFAKVAAALNEAGYRSRKGTDWSGQMVYVLTKNARQKGRLAA